ncbi:putative HTH-type transcriptional regulatorc/MT2039 [Tritonibacter multivorans]|uniref:Putative HTH-type transcriptional regulatorc/MT2039 n=1 Tax=Tritonibacter multivorans TaxID=928856 RepID=A0A0P1GHI6_9RHOB|nr:LysR family transcriptional regulator ArgP [Tritonibacter multivorans]MDA7420726.1 LysR family transcriptional regulator ArgP [Tritonibacter multivorans]CUH81056.1 putative HTH-type transcriptional regulatorc/MT2039 [Tritonibacter multivorans]SFC27019.1 LysR family transcriptional regulator, chromosome initiation inhibitor [Tritonibacter multivorans]
MQLDPNHLAALSAVLRLGSFDAAAQALFVTPSAISQRIKALEEQVGAALVQRGQPCTGTDMGLRMAKHAEDLGLLEAALLQDIGMARADPPPRLRVAVNADSLATWFVSAMARADGVLFDLVVDDQDHSADWLKRGEVSAAVTALTAPVRGCDMHVLGALEYRATASPAFVAQWFPDGVTAEAIARAPCLTYNAKDQLQRRWIRSQLGPCPEPPQHFLPSTTAFVEAAELGVGWGLNPAHLVAQAVAEGRLVELLPDAGFRTPLSWQVSRLLGAALAPVTRAVVKSGRRNLIQT